MGSLLKPATKQKNGLRLQLGALADRSGAGRFYSSRQRTTMLLLIFVAGIGLPQIASPPLRQRLASRVETLREAYAGRIHAVVLAKIGENREPFPAEYALREPPPPNYPRIPADTRESTKPPSTSSGSGVRILRILPPPADLITPAEPENAGAPATGEAAAAEADQPQYRQGTMEKEAYELLLKMSASMDRLIQGGDPSLKYESWDALKREETTYWVRIVFSSKEDRSKTEYIWQVNLQSKQITPLSFNARALAKS